MNKYETMFVLNANLDEETLNSTIESINGILTSNGANVLDTAKWGKKELAYEIKKNSEGIYVLINFEANPALIKELERVYRITDEVIKFIVVRKDEV